MKRYRVRFNERARRHYALALNWWHAYRTASPDALRDEMHEAIELLSMAPYAGRVSDDVGDVRRLLLPVSRYHVYYLVDDGAECVLIVHVWHASREAPDF